MCTSYSHSHPHSHLLKLLHLFSILQSQGWLLSQLLALVSSRTFPPLHAHGFSSAQRLLLSLSLVQTPLLRAYQPSGSLSGWSCHIHLQSGRVAGEFTSTCSYPRLLSSTTQSPGLLPLTSSQGSSCPIFLLALLSFFCLGPCTSRLWGPMVRKPLQVLSAPFPVTFCSSTSTQESHRSLQC